MLKKDIRKQFQEKRKALTAADQLRWDDLLLIQFQSVELPFINTILSFYPIEEYKEIDSFIFTDFLHFRNPNLTICYPRTNPETTTMDAVISHADTIFETNGWNIPEPTNNEIAPPEDIDLVLIPLLGFDEKGIRVGYGKGFYDRYLSQCRPDCLKIGLSYYEAVPVVEDAGDFDVPLDLCITPQRIYVF